MLCAPLFNSHSEARMEYQSPKRMIKSYKHTCQKPAPVITEHGYLLFMMVYGPIVAFRMHALEF